MFVLGINTNLRASDLVNLSVGNIRYLEPMDSLEIKEKKTGKKRRVTLNKACTEAIKHLLSSRQYIDNEKLFVGKKGQFSPITINALVKGWRRVINLKGNYGSHTLRKTWGYHQRVTYNVGIPELMVCFNHATQKQTLDYLCIQPEEIRSVYANEL